MKNRTKEGFCLHPMTKLLNVMREQQAVVNISKDWPVDTYMQK